jgi:HSP20 family protein
MGDNAAAGTFPVDIREENDQLIVEADLPGYKKDQIDVSVEQGVLTIEAERTAVENQDSKRHVNERRYTRVARRFSLPQAYNTNEVSAKLEDGVLTLSLPKREESKPRKIEVN